jgi:hypothetical protein
MSFPLKQNFVKRRTLAGKLAATLAVVTISIIPNLFKAMYYAKQSGRNKTADFDSLLTVS